MKGEVPEDLTEEPPPPIPDRVDPPFHHKFKDAMNAAYRFYNINTIGHCIIIF